MLKFLTILIVVDNFVAICALLLWIFCRHLRNFYANFLGQNFWQKADSAKFIRLLDVCLCVSHLAPVPQTGCSKNLFVVHNTHWPRPTWAFYLLLVGFLTQLIEGLKILWHMRWKKLGEMEEHSCSLSIRRRRSKSSFSSPLLWASVIKAVNWFLTTVSAIQPPSCWRWPTTYFFPLRSSWRASSLLCQHSRQMQVCWGSLLS